MWLDSSQLLQFYSLLQQERKCYPVHISDVIPFQELLGVKQTVYLDALEWVQFDDIQQRFSVHRNTGQCIFVLFNILYKNQVFFDMAWLACVSLVFAIFSSCHAGRVFINSDDFVPHIVYADDGQNKIHWDYFDILRELTHHKYALIFEKSILFVGYDEYLFKSKSFYTQSIHCSPAVNSLCVSDEGNRIFPIDDNIFLTDQNNSQRLPSQFIRLYENNCQGSGQGKGKVLEENSLSYDVSACDINQNSMSVVFTPVNSELVFRYEIISFTVHIILSVIVIVAFGYVLGFYSKKLSGPQQKDNAGEPVSGISADKAFFERSKTMARKNDLNYHKIIQLINATSCFLIVCVVQMDYNTRNFVTIDDAIGTSILMFALLVSITRCIWDVYCGGLYLIDSDTQESQFGFMMYAFTDMNVYVSVIGVITIYGTFENPLNSPVVFLIFLRVWEKMFKNIHKDMEYLEEAISTADVVQDALIASFVLHHITVQNHYKTILHEMSEVIPLFMGAFVLAKYCTLKKLLFM